MKLFHIVATSKNGIIGKKNRLPWHFSSDLRHFKELTMGSTVIMGRKTYESIGKPLPNRENFVLSRSGNVIARRPQADAAISDSGIASDASHPRNDIKVFSSFKDSLMAVKTEKAFIIGGAQLYKQTINEVDGIYLTLIDKDFEGDAFYPEIPAHFKEKTREAVSGNGVKLEFIFLERMK